MNIKFITICLVTLSSVYTLRNGYRAIPSTYNFKNYTAIVYNPVTKGYKEISMLDNDVLKNLAFAHYEDPNSVQEPKVTRPRKGTSYFQQGGSFDLTEGINAMREKRKAKEQKAKQQEQVAILTYGSIGIALLFIITAIVTFIILYIRRNRNNPYISKH